MLSHLLWTRVAFGNGDFEESLQHLNFKHHLTALVLNSTLSSAAVLEKELKDFFLESQTKSKDLFIFNSTKIAKKTWFAECNQRETII